MMGSIDGDNVPYDAKLMTDILLTWTLNHQIKVRMSNGHMRKKQDTSKILMVFR